MLDFQRVAAALMAPDGPYIAIDHVASTGSTNADLRAAAERGAADRTVLIADEQTSGVGRHGRSWVSPAGSGLYVSVLLRPTGVPAQALASLSVVAGLALTDLTDQLGVTATLKWPNDLLAGDGKIAGVLAELLPGDAAVILGIGLNVLPVGDVPPGPGGLPATSLAEHGASSTDRAEIAIALLTALAERERRWADAGGDLGRAGLREDYLARCGTIGTQVEVLQPVGESVSGRAVDVDAVGQLILETAPGQTQTVSAGDVVRVQS